MGMMYRRSAAVRISTYVVGVTFLCLTCCSGAPALGNRRGSRSADEAARPAASDDEKTAFTLSGWEPSAGFLAASALADTTDTEFPEVEEEGRKHLVRDIGVFLIVSAFVAYFVIKVFLEGDTDQPPPDDGGKVIP